MSDFEERAHGLIAGFVWGDICGWSTQGWSPGDVKDFFGDFRAPPPKWPEKVRALPTRLRRRLLPVGIHSASAQQGLSVANVLSDPGGWKLPLWIEWMVGSLDQDALRGYDRALLAAVHRLRSGMSVGSADTGLGIDAVARCVPVAIRHALQDQTAPECAAEVSLATHGELSTAVMSMALMEVLSHATNHGGDVMPLSSLISKVQHWEGALLGSNLPWTVQRGSSEDLSIRLDAYQAEQKAATIDIAEALVRLGKVDVNAERYKGLNKIDATTTYLHAFLSALYRSEEPQAILGSVVAHGGDAGPAGAIAGAILGARYGRDWIPMECFVNPERIQSYADALIEGRQAEAFPEFSENERSLTRTTEAFRRDLLAERRTGIRETPSKS